MLQKLDLHNNNTTTTGEKIVIDHLLKTPRWLPKETCSIKNIPLKDRKKRTEEW